MNGIHMIIIGAAVIIVAIILCVMDVIYAKTTAKRIKDDLRKEY